MAKLAVIYLSHTVYIVDAEQAKLLCSRGYKLGGYADTEEEAQQIADSLCK